MDREMHCNRLRLFLASEDLNFTNANRTDLGRALYAMDELGLLDTGIAAEDALLCWQLVEKLRKVPFPQELRM